MSENPSATPAAPASQPPRHPGRAPRWGQAGRAVLASVSGLAVGYAVFFALLMREVRSPAFPGADPRDCFDAVLVWEHPLGLALLGLFYVGVTFGFLDLAAKGSQPLRSGILAALSSLSVLVVTLSDGTDAHRGFLARAVPSEWSELAAAVTLMVAVVFLTATLLSAYEPKATQPQARRPLLVQHGTALVVGLLVMLALGVAVTDPAKNGPGSECIEGVNDPYGSPTP